MWSAYDKICKYTYGVLRTYGYNCDSGIVFGGRSSREKGIQLSSGVGTFGESGCFSKICMYSTVKIIYK